MQLLKHRHHHQFNLLGDLYQGAFQHDSTFLKHVLSIVLLTFLFQEVVSDIELEVSKTDVLSLLPPCATGVYTLC